MIWLINKIHLIEQLKPVYLKPSTYIDSSQEINDKDPEFGIGDILKISKHKNIFAKGFVRNSFKEVFVIKKIKITMPWTHGIRDLKGKEIVGTFYEKELQKTNQKDLEFKSNKEKRR